MKRLIWNCPGHDKHDSGCAECVQITKEMQPGYCVFCSRDMHRQVAALEKENAALLECVKAKDDALGIVAFLLHDKYSNDAEWLKVNIQGVVEKALALTPTSLTALAESRERVIEAAKAFKSHEHDEKRGQALRSLWDAIAALEGVK